MKRQLIQRFLSFYNTFHISKQTMWITFAIIVYIGYGTYSLLTSIPHYPPTLPTKTVAQAKPKAIPPKTVTPTKTALLSHTITQPTPTTYQHPTPTPTIQLAQVIPTTPTPQITSPSQENKITPTSPPSANQPHPSPIPDLLGNAGNNQNGNQITNTSPQLIPLTLNTNIIPPILPLLKNL